MLEPTPTQLLARGYRLPNRLQLAAAAPPMPPGWVPRLGTLEPAKPHPVDFGATYPGSLTAAQAADYRVALEGWAQAVTDYRLMVAVAWPLAWADALLLTHQAQQ